MKIQVGKEKRNFQSHNTFSKRFIAIGMNRFQISKVHFICPWKKVCWEVLGSNISYFMNRFKVRK